MVINRFTLIRTGKDMPTDITPAAEQQAPQPERFQTEVFKAIEILGRKLERSEAERERLAARLAQLESSAAVDQETGKLYLPSVIDLQKPATQNASMSKSVMAMMTVSVFAAFLALGAELFKAPQLPVQVGTVLTKEQLAALNTITAQHMSGLLAEGLSAQPSVKENEWQEIEQAAPVVTSEAPIAEEVIAPKVETAVTEPQTEAPPEVVAKVEAPVTAPLAKAETAEPVKVEVQKPVAKSTTPAYTPIDHDANLPKKYLRLEDRAFKGVGEAQHDLAAIYAAGKDVPQDYKRAVYWFARAADSGIANAHYNLGVMFQQGLGVREDLKKAIGWYKSAADRGHPEALYNLGIAYTDGVGVAQNAQRGAEYFKRAAQNGIAQGAYNLGVLYESGFLGNPDMKQATYWYTQAKKKGHADAQKALERLKKS